MRDFIDRPRSTHSITLILSPQDLYVVCLHSFAIIVCVHATFLVSLIRAIKTSSVSFYYCSNKQSRKGWTTRGTKIQWTLKRPLTQITYNFWILLFAAYSVWATCAEEAGMDRAAKVIYHIVGLILLIWHYTRHLNDKWWTNMQKEIMFAYYLTLNSSIVSYRIVQNLHR